MEQGKQAYSIIAKVEGEVDYLPYTILAKSIHNAEQILQRTFHRMGEQIEIDHSKTQLATPEQAWAHL